MVSNVQYSTKNKISVTFLVFLNLINLPNYFRSVTDLEDYAYYLSRVILFAPLLMATMLSSIILIKNGKDIKRELWGRSIYPIE